ncbi:MAG: PepSY-associated TM helix domain-containing protein [Edaphobacter sp.]|uniref:PepSY-associated TM helix domain-containing protein n=1 Tax=Edaphobacter sp. TaxID=1934404 RepID=UPI0023899851|nr:PepSY-associated TM helix domain-containing protein [Edaphobacter sp.]MDE1178209.1 PepSY-associated TM helix domain-containing protein [Edaphobacter sp.]
MSFFDDLIHHPRRLFLRRVVFQVHLWLGVLLSLYLVLISLSGALLVYHDTLTRITLPSGFSTYDLAHTASVPTVMEAAQAAFPGATVTYLHMPYARLPVFQLQLRDAAKKQFAAVADPQTGRVVLLRRTWVDVVYDFHTELLLGSSHGVQWNGAGAAGLLILALSGLLLWWRGLKTWWHGLGVSLRHKWRRINYDLHHAIGLWTLLIVSWWALSGIYFAWYTPFTSAVNAVSPLVGMREPNAEPSPHDDKPAKLEVILDAAQKASRHGRLTYFFNPSLSQGEEVIAYMNLRTPEDFGHADIVRFDAKTGTIVSLWHYGQNRSAGDWFLWAMQPIHFGTLWGPWVRALWCLFGILLAVLTISGLLMYWNRYLRFRWRYMATLRTKLPS